MTLFTNACDICATHQLITNLIRNQQQQTSSPSKVAISQNVRIGCAPVDSCVNMIICQFRFSFIYLVDVNLLALKRLVEPLKPLSLQRAEGTSLTFQWLFKYSEASFDRDRSWWSRVREHFLSALQGIDSLCAVTKCLRAQWKQCHFCLPFTLVAY